MKFGLFLIYQMPFFYFCVPPKGMWGEGPSSIGGSSSAGHETDLSPRSIRNEETEGGRERGRG